jgi:hypothetical protein
MIQRGQWHSYHSFTGGNFLTFLILGPALNSYTGLSRGVSAPPDNTMAGKGIT